jgi:serine/threonine-protein kinase HipA
MDRSGTWQLSPAYDMAYSYNPSGSWTRDHQMSLAGKRNDFAHGDLMVFASNVGLKSNRANQAIEDVVDAVAMWQEFAEQAGVEHSDMSRIEKTFRMNLRG